MPTDPQDPAREALIRQAAFDIDEAQQRAHGVTFPTTDEAAVIAIEDRLRDLSRKLVEPVERELNREREAGWEAQHRLQAIAAERNEAQERLEGLAEALEKAARRIEERIAARMYGNYASDEDVRQAVARDPLLIECGAALAAYRERER